MSKYQAFLTIKEVSQILRLSESTIRRYIKANKIPYTQENKHAKILININDVSDFVVNNMK